MARLRLKKCCAFSKLRDLLGCFTASFFAVLLAAKCSRAAVSEKIKTFKHNYVFLKKNFCVTLGLRFVETVLFFANKVMSNLNTYKSAVNSLIIAVKFKQKMADTPTTPKH